MFTKVKVLDINEKPINFYLSFLRESPYLLFSIMLIIIDTYEILAAENRENLGETVFHNILYVITFVWLVAEIIVTLSNDKRRSIHDYIAGTVVVNLSESDL